MELINGLRYRAMLVEESPAMAEYEVADWAPLLECVDVDAGSLLGMFRSLRRANVSFWQHLDAAGRARVGIHPEYGPETIDLRFRVLAGHDRMHLAQARHAVETARGLAATPGKGATSKR